MKPAGPFPTKCWIAFCSLYPLERRILRLGTRAHLAKRLLSVHCRHGQVEDDAGDFFPLHADDVKGFPAVRRDKCDESQVLQHLAANNPDAHFVVNEENGAITLNLRFACLLV